MTEETDYFLSQDGLKLHYRFWTGESPKRILCIIHGHGEHSDRYEHLALALTARGTAVFAMDIRGHGLSRGKRGHAKSLDLLLSDIEELLKTVRAIYTDLPMFLMGHSMGGCLVANYMIQMNTNEIEGFILSSPWFRLAFDPPAWKVKLGRFVIKVFPSLTQPNDLNASHLSKDEEVVKAYKNDPLVHNRISAKLYDQIAHGGEYALKNAGSITKRGLIYHGDADQIIDWKATKEFARQCKTAEWKQLKGVYHEPHNDLEKEEVLKMLDTWVKSRQ